MKWILVIVYMYQGEAYVEKIEEYSSMYDCFYGFDEYSNQIPKKGTQLVCIEDET